MSILDEEYKFALEEARIKIEELYNCTSEHRFMNDLNEILYQFGIDTKFVNQELKEDDDE